MLHRAMRRTWRYLLNPPYSTTRYLKGDMGRLTYVSINDKAGVDVRFLLQVEAKVQGYIGKETNAGSGADEDEPGNKAYAVKEAAGGFSSWKLEMVAMEVIAY